MSMKEKLVAHIEANGNPINTNNTNPRQQPFKYHASDDGSDLEATGRAIIRNIPGRPSDLVIVVDDGDTYYEMTQDLNGNLDWENRKEVRCKWIDTAEIGYKDKREPDLYAASQSLVMQDAFQWAVANGYSIETGQHFLTDTYGRPVDTTVFINQKTGDKIDYNALAIERGWAGRAYQVGDSKTPNASLTVTQWDVNKAERDARNAERGIWSPELRLAQLVKEQEKLDEQQRKHELSVNKKYNQEQFDLSDPVNISKFKIGDVWLEIPPTHISINQLRSSYNVPLLGFEAKPVQGALTNRIIVKVNTIFDNISSINNDLLRILYQFRYVPVNIIRSKDLFFRVAAEASWLNTAYGLRGDYCVPVTMDSYTLYTIEGHPGTIGCSLQFSVFNFCAYFNNAADERVEYFKYSPEKFNLQNGIFKLASNVGAHDIWETTVDLEQSIHPYNFVVERKITDSYKLTKHDENLSYFFMAKIDKNLTEKEGDLASGSSNVITDRQIRYFAESVTTDIAHSISISYENNFAWQPLLGYAQPIAQYVGPGETQVSVNIKTDNEKNIRDYLKTYADKIDPGRYGLYDDRYWINAALLNLADVNIASIQHVSVHNIEGKPGWFDVNLMFNKSSYASLIQEGNEPQAADEYWGLQRINKLFDQQTIRTHMDRISTILASKKSATPLYRIKNPYAKDIDGLNIAFKSDVNAALEFIENNWGRIAPGIRQHNALSKNEEVVKHNDAVAANSPIDRMVVAQGKLKESEVKNRYQWEALKARKEIQDATGIAVYDIDASQPESNQLKSLIYYEALTKEAKKSVQAVLKKNSGSWAAAMDGRLVEFDIPGSNKDEARIIVNAFNKVVDYKSLSGYNNLSPRLKARYQVKDNNTIRIYITSKEGDSYTNTGFEMPSELAHVVYQINNVDKKKIENELKNFEITNRPLAAHRYMEGIDYFINNNLLGSRTMGYWYATNRIKNIEKHISHIVDELNNHTIDIAQTDGWKNVFVKDTIEGKKIQKDIASLVDQGNPYSVMKAAVYPSLKKDASLYDYRTMDIDKNIVDLRPGVSEGADFAFTSWSDNLLNNDYLSSGQKMKRWTDAYAASIASRVEYNLPAGTANYYEVVNDSNNVLFGNINPGSNVLVKRSSYSNSQLSDGMYSDMSKVSTPVQLTKEVFVLNQHVLSMNKNMQFTADTKEKPVTPKPVKIRKAYKDDLTFEPQPMEQTPIKVGDETVAGSSGARYKSVFSKDISKSYKLHNRYYKDGEISTNETAAYYRKIPNKKANDELNRERQIAANTPGNVFDTSMEPGTAKPRGNGVSDGAIDDQIRNYMASQLPTFGMQNAFPTFKMYIISDETSEYKYKMLDMYWDYRLVQDMMVIRDKNNPSHILKARVLVDPRYTTTSDRINQRIGTERSPLEAKTTGNWDLADTKNAYSFSQSRSPLRQGMRICIKLGYHTDPRALDTVFIGTITGLQGTQENGVYNIEARGDGRELLVPATIQDYSLHGDTFGDLINIMLRSNPNIRHFGKVYGSFIERFTREHQEWVRFLSQNFKNIPIFAGNALVGAGAGATLFALTANPITSSIGAAVGLSGGWLAASFAGAAGVGAAAALGTTVIASNDKAARDLIDKGFHNWHKYDLGGKVTTWVNDIKSRLKGQIFNADKASYQLTRHMHQVYEYNNNPIDDNIFAVDIFAQGQGKDVNLKVNNQKSVWDVLVNIKRMYPGWALDVRPYGNRSTIYLGPIGFNYWRTDDPFLAMAPSLIQMDRMRSIGDNATLANEKNNAVKLMIKRDKFGNRDIESGMDQGVAPFIPFVKHHSVSSYEDIIYNGIRCTPERGWNSVVVSGANNSEPEEFVANEALFRSNIRRKFEVVDWTSNDRLRKQYAIGLLKEGVEKLYGGTLIIRGNPKIEPYDRIMISDNVNRMYGTFEVETVIHKFDNEMGFTTHIVPNMVCSINDSSYLTQGDITKRVLLEKMRNIDYSTFIENGLLIGAGAFLPFWPMLAIMGTAEMARFIINNRESLKEATSVTDKKTGSQPVSNDVGWAMKAREISVNSNIDLADVSLGKVIRGIYELNKKGSLNWNGVKDSTKVGEFAKAKAERAGTALTNLKKKVKEWSSNKEAAGFLDATKKSMKSMFKGSVEKDAAKLAAEEAESAASKTILKSIVKFGGPVLKTGGGLMIFGMLEAIPMIFETYMFKAASKNQVISVKPMWSKDSLMMQGLEGYKNSDVWMHTKDLIVNAGEVTKEAWEAVKNYDQDMVQNDFDTGGDFGEAQASMNIDRFGTKSWWFMKDTAGVSISGSKVPVNITSNPLFKEYQGLISKVSKETGVPTALINAVIYHESGYKANATHQNPNGTIDQGLMQINSIHGVQNVFNPVVNITWGAKYLATCIKKNGGNVALGVARYNGSGVQAQQYSQRIMQLYSQFNQLGA